MKLLLFVVVAVLAMAQAKFMMSPNALSAAMESNTIDDEGLTQAAMQDEKLYIPMSRHVSCNNGGCVAICHALGFKYGRCVSPDTCKCYN